MATKKSCFWYVFILQGTLFFDSSAFANERATRDLRCTQKQITTSTGQQATLGCYTTQLNSSSLKYSWKKDNVTVTPSSYITVYANMLIVTPEDDTDFGTYECHDGVSNTSCSISLRSRQESEGYTNVVTGCVNLAVLMPVLAVMMVSLLLNVHFLIQWRRRQRFLLSEEEIYQLHLAREAIAVNHEDQEEENVEVKKKKFFGGRFKKCKKEGDKRENDHENIQDSSNLDKDKGEAIEMQESKDFLNTQDGSRALDIPREQDSSWEKKRPWEHHDDVTRADDNQEILRLDDILRVQETSTPVQDSMNEWESPRSIDSAGTKGIPRLEDILREQDSSLPTQDHSHELDSPRTQESPRTKEIPRLEEIFSASEGEAKENLHGETRPDVSVAHHRSTTGSLQAPRIAEFFLPSDESDAERQSVTSEEPLVSHYMEKMDFEKENDDEHGEEPLVSHYMEKMDFEKGNEDNVQDQEPLVSYYKEKMDFEESNNDEEPVLK